MARFIQRIVEAPRPCSYLEAETAQLDMMVLVDVGADELDALLSRGFRHFGPVYFRPRCAPCMECVTVRIPVGTFVPSRSQKRARKAAARFRREVGVPIVDEERLALYRRWHAGRERERGWGASEVDAERYALDFAFPQETGREVRFHDDAAGGRIVGVGIVDRTTRASSAVYFFYDPDLEHVSLGVAHVVMLIEEARALGLEHVYLGYLVEGCASLAYKGRFHPHERLVGRPAMSETPTWSLRVREDDT